MDKDNVTDPQEDPTNTGHLPVSGEVIVGHENYEEESDAADTDGNA